MGRRLARGALRWVGRRPDGRRDRYQWDYPPALGQGHASPGGPAYGTPGVYRPDRGLGGDRYRAARGNLCQDGRADGFGPRPAFPEPAGGPLRRRGAAGTGRGGVTVAELLWLTSRTAALTAFFVIAAALITGQALRTFVLEGWVGRREVVAVHGFQSVCWAPLVAVHVLAGMLDPVSRLTPLDAVIPLRVPYAALPIGLGTLGFDVLLVVGVTSYLRKQMDAATWRWLHRTSYLMFGLMFLHAVLSGTDLGRPVIAAAVWATFSFVVILTVARVAIGRVSVST